MQDDPASLADVLVKALEATAGEFWLRHSDLSDVLRRIEAGERLSLGSPPWLVHASLLMHFGRRADAIATIDRAASRGPRGFDYQRFRDRVVDPA
jgi:hypothetical protein